jgi:DNA-binding MarR family transcriptional regulator
MPPSERLGLDIKRAEHALMAAKGAALRRADLTVAQYAALFTLKDNPGMSAAAVSRACLVTPQAMTSVLRTLEDRGLVERRTHPWYQHVRQIELTEAGERAVTAADREAVRIETRIHRALTADERDTLRQLLSRCVDAIAEE